MLTDFQFQLLAYSVVIIILTAVTVNLYVYLCITLINYCCSVLDVY